MNPLAYTAGNAGPVATRMPEHITPVRAVGGAIPTGKRTGTFPSG